MLNVCMVGYGMMGDWHSQALAKSDAVLHTLVGRRAEPALEVCRTLGYRRWLLSLDEALADVAPPVCETPDCMLRGHDRG